MCIRDRFATIENKLGKLPIIAEDLGFLTDSVKQLLASTGFPGMKAVSYTHLDVYKRQPQRLLNSFLLEPKHRKKK